MSLTGSLYCGGKRILANKHVVVLVSRSCSAGIAPSLEDSSHLEDNVKPFSAIPGPRGLPYLGTLLEFRSGFIPIKEYHKMYERRYNKYGPIFKETRLGHTTVHLMDPDYVKTVFSVEGKSPYAPPLADTVKIYRESRDMSPGLGNSNGPDWVRMRSAVRQLMMRPMEVNQFLPGVNEVIHDFILRMEDIRDTHSGQVPDFGNEVTKWQLESAGNIVFETRLGSLESFPDSRPQKMIDANDVFFILTNKLKFALPFWKYLGLRSWTDLAKAEDYFFRCGQDLMDQTLAEIERLSRKGQLKAGQYKFLSYMVSKTELSRKDVSIISLGLLNEGLRTTVPCLLGQIYMLAANPDKQQILREEVNRVTQHTEGCNISAADIKNMPYLRACIKEGFRFFPLGVDTSRILQADLAVGGYNIPAGTHVELNNNMLLRMSAYFSDPESFVPERWLRGNDKEEQVHPYLLIPFGHGPRNCAGKRFAEMEMSVMLAQLVKHYEIAWPHSKPMEQMYNVLLCPDTPPQFQFTPVHQSQH